MDESLFGEPGHRQRFRSKTKEAARSERELAKVNRLASSEVVLKKVELDRLKVKDSIPSSELARSLLSASSVYDRMRRES